MTALSPTHMDRRRLYLAAVGILALPTRAQDGSAIDGPRGRFDDDLISRLEGRWSLFRQIRGVTVRNDAEATWILNHQFLELRMKDVASPPRYEAIVLIGYIYSDKKYIAHWTDTYGAKFSAMGRGTRSGNSVEFRFEYPDGPFFNTFTWHPDREQWVFRMESQGASGARDLFAIDTLSKAR